MQADRPMRRLVAALAAAACAASLAMPAAAAAQEKNKDPWQGLNRSIFRFNDALDRWILEPTARGYEVVMPDLVEGWVTNFLANLWFPVTFTNCVLQAKPQEATQSLARFMLNTTIGIGGFGDPATRLDVPAPNEDFGQTLGYWGVRPGPFLMLPILGPSNVRDTVGRVADSATRVWPYFSPWYSSTGTSVVEVVNTRARFLDQVEDLRESSVDYYASVRDAYLQRREALVEDRIGGAQQQKNEAAEFDLYFPEDAED